MKRASQCSFLLACLCLTANALAADPSKTEPSKTEPAKTEPPKVAAPKANPAKPAAPKKIDPAMVTISDDPKLPRVLLIGDSISMGYTVPVRNQLQGVANVHRILTNGAHTNNGVENIDKWLADGKWDVIHFNFGLHDLKLIDGKHQVELNKYEQNLQTIVGKLEKTGAKLIWASTTPVPEGKLNPPREPKDVQLFNTAAKKIMDEHKIAIDDLYTFVVPQQKQLQHPADVHYSNAGYQALGGEVAKSIKEALGKK